MELEDFYAGRASAPMEDGYGEHRSVKLTTQELGTLALPTGVAGVYDPFMLTDYFLGFEVPEKKARVVVTFADVSEDESEKKEGDSEFLREAYFSLIFSDEKPVAVQPAINFHATPKELELGLPAAVAVDAGAVSFFDGFSMEQYLQSMTEDELQDVSEDWVEALYDEEPYPAGVHIYEYAPKSFVRDPELEAEPANIFMVTSGWGDGVYPVLETVDENGDMLGLHIDLLVVGKDSED